MTDDLLQIPPLPGAVPRTGGEAGHPAGASPPLSPPGNLSTVPAHLEHSRETGRTTGAGTHPETAAHPELPAPAKAGVEGRAPADQFIPVAAMEAILAERHRQIHHFGHTPQADAKLPCRQLPRAAEGFLIAAIEDIHFHKPDWRKHARRHLAQAGAMILAAIDRLEAEPEEEEF